MNFGYFWVFWRIFFGYTGIPLPLLADPDSRYLWLEDVIPDNDPIDLVTSARKVTDKQNKQRETTKRQARFMKKAIYAKWKVKATVVLISKFLLRESILKGI